MDSLATTPQSRIERINGDLLTPIVRRLVGSPKFEIAGWEATLLKGRADAGMVFRVSGSGVDPAEGHRDWSVILKIGRVQRREAASRKENYREAMFYEAAIGEAVPGGFRTPACWSITQMPGDMPWIWLEDIDGTPADQWLAPRYALAAYHLGRFQGAFLAGRACPADPAFDRTDQLYEDTRNCVRKMLPAILENTANHPLSRPTYGGEIGERLRQLADKSDHMLNAISRTPLTFCHRDFGAGNILSHTLPDATEETIGIDWDFCGTGQIGIDTQGFISACAIRPGKSVSEAREFTETVFDRYIDGLVDAGWQGETGAARYACTALLGLQGSLHLAIYVNMLLTLWGEKSQSRIDTCARLQTFLLDQTGEAEKLEKYIE